MDCWQREIDRSKTEAEVIARTADFMSLWSPRELAPVTLGWREVSIASADDIERVKKWLEDDMYASMAAEVQPLRELGDYLWHASERIREVRQA